MKKSLIIGLIILVPLVIIAVQLISISNKDNVLRNQFNQKFSERTAFYDAMWKTISQKGQIAVKNDSSFQKNINIIMSNRKDAEGLFMKWVTESNPNANYQVVSELYADLGRTIEAKREQFFEQEKMMQDIKLQSDNVLSTIPAGTILRHLFGRTYIKYKPITSDQTDDVIRTGKDNNVKVF